MSPLNEGNILSKRWKQTNSQFSRESLEATSQHNNSHLRPVPVEKIKTVPSPVFDPGFKQSPIHPRVSERSLIVCDYLWVVLVIQRDDACSDGQEYMD